MTLELPLPSLPSPFLDPLGIRYSQHMDPSGLESGAIPWYYNGGVAFYEFHHQIGKYVSRLVPMDKTLREHLLAHPFSHSCFSLVSP